MSATKIVVSLTNKNVFRKLQVAHYLSFCLYLNICHLFYSWCSINWGILPHYESTIYREWMADNKSWQHTQVSTQHFLQTLGTFLLAIMSGVLL